MKKYMAIALAVTASPAFLVSSSSDHEDAVEEISNQHLLRNENGKIALARDEFYTAASSYRDSYTAFIETTLSEKYEGQALTPSDTCMLTEFSGLLSDWAVARDSIKFAESFSGKHLLSNSSIEQGFTYKMSAIRPYCESLTGEATTLRNITLDKPMLSALAAYESKQRSEYISSIANYSSSLIIHKKSKVDILISGGPAVTESDTCIASALTQELATSQLTRDLIFTYVTLLPANTITYDGLKEAQDFELSKKLRLTIAECEAGSMTRANAFHALTIRANLPDFDEGLRSISPKAPFARTYPDPNYKPDYI